MSAFLSHLGASCPYGVRASLRTHRRKEYLDLSALVKRLSRSEGRPR